jgi:hypothetical protein
VPDRQELYGTIFAMVYTAVAPTSQPGAASRQTKWCPLCSTYKNVKDFYVGVGHADGLKSACKRCENMRTVENRRRRRAGLPPLPKPKRTPPPVAAGRCLPAASQPQHQPPLPDPAAAKRRAVSAAAKLLIASHRDEFSRWLAMFSSRHDSPLGPREAQFAALNMLIEQHQIEWGRIYREEAKRQRVPPGWVSAAAPAS